MTVNSLTFSSIVSNPCLCLPYKYCYPGGGLSGAPGPHLPGGHPGQPPGHQRGEEEYRDNDDNDLNQ